MNIGNRLNTSSSLPCWHLRVLLSLCWYAINHHILPRTFVTLTALICADPPPPRRLLLLQRSKCVILNLTRLPAFCPQGQKVEENTIGTKEKNWLKKGKKMREKKKNWQLDWGFELPH